METNTNTQMQTPAVPDMQMPGEKASGGHGLATGLAALGIVLAIAVGVGGFLMMSGLDFASKDTEVKVLANEQTIATLSSNVESIKQSQLTSASVEAMLATYAKTDDLKLFMDFLKANDTDGDGLSDYDELVTYKTDHTIKDTDKDGFTDKEEVDGGFNPLGDGKLDLTTDTTIDDGTNGKVVDDSEDMVVNKIDDYLIDGRLNDSDLLSLGTEPTDLEEVATATRYFDDECPKVADQDGPCGGDLIIYASEGWEEIGSEEQTFYLHRPQAAGPGTRYHGPFTGNLETLSLEAIEFVYSE